MAIRKLLFPEATVSQTASYCLTAGLWCRAQTLSPTLPTPPPPSSSSPSPPFPLRPIIFIRKPIPGYKGKRDERKRSRGEERHAERRSGAGEENCDSSEALIDATSVCLQCTLPAKKGGGSIDLLPYFNQKKKKWVLNPRFSSVLENYELPASH